MWRLERSDQTGVAGRKTIEMLPNEAESIDKSETILGRMLGYGAIEMIGTPELFDQVAHPLEFRSRMQQQIEKLH